ncbi:MAG: gluconate 2-dehydrogenase subunit 3 family protein [Saprospiraceae bacterium]|nr:gluconate 2-dehydrogenase subunit 3 family protein [Saprospiraceae bacterium]
MDRRDILKASAIFLGYGLVGGTSIAVLNGCKADTSDGWKPSFFTADQIDTLAEVAERIIPKTDTPGAKEALVHRYIDEAVKNNYKSEEQEFALKAADIFDMKSTEKFNKKFVAITDAQKDEILQELADLSKNEEDQSDAGEVFPRIRSLVAAGYFTSEIGATQALIYDPIPGPFEGCIPLSDVGGVYSLRW